MVGWSHNCEWDQPYKVIDWQGFFIDYLVLFIISKITQLWCFLYENASAHKMWLNMKNIYLHYLHYFIWKIDIEKYRSIYCQSSAFLVNSQMLREEKHPDVCFENISTHFGITVYKHVWFSWNRDQNYCTYQEQSRFIAFQLYTWFQQANQCGYHSVRDFILTFPLLILEIN